MAKFKDLQGQKFGRLTVLERVANSHWMYDEWEQLRELQRKEEENA